MSTGDNLPMKWADRAMFPAEGHGGSEGVDIKTGVVPTVKLLWMTPDPLGAIAAMAAMYEGRVIRHLDDLSNEDRVRYFEDVCKTHLDTPLEAVKFQFLFEGVDRATTHQIVRARHQTYAQESLRFAVIDDLQGGTSLPPSLWGTDPLQFREVNLSPEERARAEQRQVWDNALATVEEAYATLVARGMPAEEARGLLPHATATRVVVVTDLRSLKAEAGNRLCTQAQFHWRLLFTAMIDAIRKYGLDDDSIKIGDGWQFRDLASSEIFRPVCYQLGRCPFKASFDRHCNIRERVDKGRFADIRTEEWLADPAAARRK